MSNLTRFSGAHRPIPRATAFPSDYGFALAASALVRDYGKDGAVNRLIEMAERISAGENALNWALSRAVLKEKT